MKILWSCLISSINQTLHHSMTELLLKVSLNINTLYFVPSTLIIRSQKQDLVLLHLIRVITKIPNSEQSYKGKVKTHKYINRQNQSTTGKL